MSLHLHSPTAIQRALAGRARDARLALGLKQATLSSAAGVTLATLRRFEQTGEISLKYLLRICNALGRLDDFDRLLLAPAAATMAELEARVQKRRRRGFK